MIIPQSTINEVLSVYNPEAKVLQTASLKYPIIEGTFQLNPTFYMSPLNHATDIEIQLCLNQLGYAGIYEAMRNKMIEGLKNERFENLQEEGMFIIESKKRFRRPIGVNYPFHGRLEVKEIVHQGNLIVFRMDLDFEKRSCIGNLEAAIVKVSKGAK